MIYFNDKKEAFAFEIPNYVAKIEDTIWMEYSDSDKWDIIGNEFSDVTDTPEYQYKKQQQEKELRKQRLQEEINELDKKRIRAVCEPSMKTESQSWLEFYNEQIRVLREVMASLD